MVSDFLNKNDIINLDKILVNIDNWEIAGIETFVAGNFQQISLKHKTADLRLIYTKELKKCKEKKLNVIIKDLKPYGNFPKAFNFREQVDCLTRPYQVINETEYDWLFNQGYDVFCDKTGNLYSFGDADGGQALMPINSRSKFLIERIFCRMKHES